MLFHRIESMKKQNGNSVTSALNLCNFFLPVTITCIFYFSSSVFLLVFKRHEMALHQIPTPNIGFSKVSTSIILHYLLEIILNE